MYANDVDVERRRSVIIIIPANDDGGSCGIDGRLLLLPFIIFIEEELSIMKLKVHNIEM